MKSTYECGLPECPGTVGVAHRRAQCPALPAHREKREARVCAAISKRADDYRIEAASKLLACGLECEGDFMDADEHPVIPIGSEIPGAWVPVFVWVPARDLPPKKRRA